MAKILIVEDEKSINNLIRMNLSLVGHECVQLYDGESAITLAEKEKFDLIILDVMLPKCSGFDVIERISSTPVIFVTAKNKVEDRIKGLKLGGDDYIVKPFDIYELIARTEAVLRRTKKTENKFSLNDLTVDFSKRTVVKSGREVALKPKEFDLLEVLIINRNIALTRDKLINLVWGYDYSGDTRTVDVHIQQLRKKLGLEDSIKTIYKTGYRLEV